MDCPSDFRRTNFSSVSRRRRVFIDKSLGVSAKRCIPPRASNATSARRSPFACREGTGRTLVEYANDIRVGATGEGTTIPNFGRDALITVQRCRPDRNIAYRFASDVPRGVHRNFLSNFILFTSVNLSTGLTVFGAHRRERSERGIYGDNSVGSIIRIENRARFRHCSPGSSSTVYCPVPADQLRLSIFSNGYRRKLVLSASLFQAWLI